MSGNKRYYWLKLNENFFESEEIKVIQDMKNGKDYIIFYMKLLLKAIKTEGKLLFRNIIPYTPEMLSSITNTDIDTVKVAIDVFAKLGLMEIWDDGTLFMIEVQGMIGSESGSAERIRRYREKQELQKEEVKALHCNNNVQKSNTEIEKELEKELELEKEEDIVCQRHTPYQQISELFNSICITLPNIKDIKGNRQKSVRVWYKELDNGIDDVKEFFQRVHDSDFLSGRNDKWSNCCFDWIIKPGNRQKIIEGTYDNKGNRQSNQKDSNNVFADMLRDGVFDE